MEMSALLLNSYASTLLVGAVCFAIGYLLASKSHFFRHFLVNDDGDYKKTTLNGPKNGILRLPFKRSRPVEDNKKSELVEIENLAEIYEDFKMVLVVRNDLKMGKGKIAAQCSHATLGLYKRLNRKAPKALNRWEMCGQVKVVLKIESEEDMLMLQARAKSLRLPTHITVDAGRTQIAPNSRTVMAILGPADVVDDVTGGLKLL